MIISSKQIGEVLKAKNDQRRTGQVEQRPLPGSPVRGRDQVTLSSRATEVSMIRSHLKDVPEVRAERVKEISEALERGDYRVNAEDVADKMVGRLLADRLK